MKTFCTVLNRSAMLAGSLLTIVVLLAFGACQPNNTPEHKTNLIALHEGCYASGDTAYLLLFPADQHGGQYVTAVQQQDSMMVAMRPSLLTQYNDTTGTGSFIAMDTQIGFSTNGKDSLWLTAAGDTMVFVLQAEVSHAPKSLSGTWRMSYDVNAYVSIRLWDAVISEDLHCDVEFNVPDSAGLMMMLETLGAMSETEMDMGEMFEGVPLSEMLAAIPSGLSGDVWYSAAAGMGVFVPNVEEYNSDYSLFFTTPEGGIIRLTFGSYNLDMKRIK